MNIYDIKISDSIEPSNKECIGIEQGDFKQLDKIPEGILSLYEIVTLLNLAEKTSHPVLSNLLPRVKKPNCKSIFEFCSQYHDVHGVADIREENSWTASRPFEANVVNAKWLTSESNFFYGQKELQNDGIDWGATRRVIHLELSLKSSGIEYEPGDSIGICCPNLPYATNLIMERLKENDNSMTESVIVKNIKTEELTTIKEIFSYKYDLMSAPKKAVVASLALLCNQEQDRLLMQHLCSKSEIGKQLWSLFVDQQNLNLAELIYFFPSCNPTFDQLITLLTPIPPRYYSIASSPLVHSSSLSIAFSVVRNKFVLTIGNRTTSINRSGVCTSYLEALLRPWLSNFVGDQRLECKIKIFLKSSIHFHLPGSVATPLILIGPGTGVAPFIGFLEHRMFLEEHRLCVKAQDMCVGMWRGGFEMEEEDLPSETCSVGSYIKSVAPGIVQLYFGCRNKDDFLFEQELQHFLNNGTITNLEIAMSRVTEQKNYVFHKLFERGDQIADLMLNKCCSIYLCGDGNSMAKDVNNSIIKILVCYGNMTEDDAMAYIEDMKIRRRYVMDIWS